MITDEASNDIAAVSYCNPHLKYKIKGNKLPTLYSRIRSSN